jgi:hypothetical protein
VGEQGVKLLLGTTTKADFQSNGRAADELHGLDEVLDLARCTRAKSWVRALGVANIPSIVLLARHGSRKDDISL